MEILIVANWKSNKNSAEAKEWLDKFLSELNTISLPDHIKIIICPPFTDLPLLSSELQNYEKTSLIKLGAQNVSSFPEGSYTGEVSAKHLLPYSTYCLVGHSERRINLKETTEEVMKKINLLIESGITPILCAQNESEIPEEVKKIDPTKILIMFEPAKAISTNGVYKAETPETVSLTINKWREKFGNFTFLYGGSVNEENCANLLKAGINGFVVGHASLSPESFLGIIKNV